MYVLAADSDPVMCKAIKFLLDSDGHEVAVTSTGAGLVSLAQEREPDLFVLDMALPDIDCLKIYEHLRRQGSTARVIFLVPANDSILRSSEGLELAAGDFIVKPFEPDHLISRVRKIATAVDAFGRKRRAPKVSVGDIQLLPDLGKLILHRENLTRILNISPAEAEIAFLLLKSNGEGMTLQTIARQLGLAASDTQILDAIADCIHGLRLKTEDDLDHPRYFVVAEQDPCPSAWPHKPLSAVADGSPSRLIPRSS